MKKLFFVFFFAVVLVPLFSQISDYIPMETHTADSNLYISRLKARHEKDKLNVTSTSYKKQYYEAYEERYENLHYKISNSHVIFDDSLTRYFHNVISEICTKNEELNCFNFEVFVSNYSWPNAACYGEGTFVVNLGLIRRLNNESELAFILSHELAHYFLNHVNSSISNSIERINSKEFKNQIKELDKIEYNKREKLLNLYKGVLYTDRKHSREHEKAADSLGFIFFKNTSYNVKGSIYSLEILDKVDSEKYLSGLDIESTFTFGNYPFKKRWLTDYDDESIFGDMKSKDSSLFNKDSIKTHPDCTDRIEYISEYLKKLNIVIDQSKKEFIQPEYYFKELVAKSDFEYIESIFNSKDYGKAIFESLQLLKHYPENAYLHHMVGNCLFIISIAQKEHKASLYLDYKNKNYSDEYNNFLIFIRNLSYKELYNLSVYYMISKKEYFHTNENYLYNFIKAVSIENNFEISDESLKELYLQKFPNGKYTSMLNK